MFDNKENLATTKEEIEKVISEHYTKVLENRKIKEGLEYNQKQREYLCKKRIEAAKKVITPNN